MNSKNYDTETPQSETPDELIVRQTPEEIAAWKAQNLQNSMRFNATVMQTNAELIAECNTLRGIIQRQWEDWAVCHTFLQNAGFQMDPTDSYSGATTLIEGMELLVAERNALRAFAKEVVQVHLCDCGVLDLQDIATIHGLLYGGHPTPLLTGASK